MYNCASGKCRAYLGSRVIKKDNAGDSDADTTHEEMAEPRMRWRKQPMLVDARRDGKKKRDKKYSKGSTCKHGFTLPESSHGDAYFSPLI